jgi:hypothetical protein
MEYIYIGDKQSDLKYKGKLCKAIRVNDKCVRGKNTNMLVEFEDSAQVVILARLLRKLRTAKPG